MQVEVVDGPGEVARTAAELVWEAVRLRPEGRIALPTGATPVPMYAELRRRVESGAYDFSGATAYAIDEFCDATATTPGTNSAFYRQHVCIGAKALRCPDPAAPDPEQHIRAFAEEIRQGGGVSLCVLGIGVNGHVAFNEPGAARDSRARVVELTQTSRLAHAATFGELERVPERGMTLGVADLLEAHAILVLVTGAHKAAIVRAAIEGPATTDVPASWLHEHANITWLLDRDAASMLGR